MGVELRSGLGIYREGRKEGERGGEEEGGRRSKGK